MKIQSAFFAFFLLTACQSEAPKSETTQAPAPVPPPAAATTEPTPPPAAAAPAPVVEKPVAPIHTHAAPKPQAKAPVPASGFANSIDPICDMEVMASWTDTAHYQHKVYAFCSEYCKDAFKADPKKYLAIMK